MDRRRAMIETIAEETRLTSRETGRSRLHPRVLEAMEAVPRDAFVPDELAPEAWDNRPLPIGSGQTISQPFIVALMTDLLDPEPGDRVLEVGTGCGYQAAVLSRLVATVYTIEFLPELAHTAGERLAALGCDNVQMRTGDGCAGWPEEAPFDGIIVTAGARRVPDALIEQLGPDARLVIPLGAGRMGQDLCVITRDRHGGIAQRSVLPVAFVPLRGS